MAYNYVFGTFFDDLIISLDDKHKKDKIAGLFGEDEIYGGRGNDYIAGDVDESIAVIDIPHVYDNLVFFNASDRIYGGQGNDVLAGDYLKAKAYWLADAQNQVFGFGHDTIEGGDGNDVIAGDILDEQGFQLDVVADSDPDPDGIQFTVYLGNDHLDGGNGNDLIIGDQGHANIFASNAIVNGVVYLGNDTLLGGKGNDELVGDSNVEVRYENHASGGFVRYLGNDYLDGGEGNDLLIGDAKLNVATQDETVNMAFTEYFGNDVLRGGAGNDVLWGDVVELQGLPGSIAIMGQDTFVYNLQLKEGRDIIMDFSATDDMLKFEGVVDKDANGVDIHDLDLMVDKFAANADHTLRIDFKGGTSISFATIHFDNQTSMADLVSNPDQIIFT